MTVREGQRVWAPTVVRTGPDPTATAGSAVVLVHGIGMSRRYFARLVAALGTDRRVLTLDLPGFGDAPGPRHALGMEDLAAGVAAVLADEGLVAPVLVGHSMGAQVVAEVAAQHPGTVGRLVLLGPVIGNDVQPLLRLAGRLVRDVPHERARANVRTVHDYLRCGPVRYLETVPSMLRYPLLERLALGEAPVVLVRGVEDRVCSTEDLRALAAAAGGAEVVEVPGAGHQVMDRQPDAVARLCR